MNAKGCLLSIALGIVGLAVIVGIYGVISYNGLVSSKQGVDAKWADVETMYQRRADLIPNLVKTVEGAANFEKSTLTEITTARASVGQIKLNGAPDAQQLEAFEKAQSGLSSALSRLLVVVERYPDLKSNQNFIGLQAELAGTENRISTARHDFNEVVQGYNSRVLKFPTVFIARMMGYTERGYFKAKEGTDTPPEVKFDFGNKK